MPIENVIAMRPVIEKSCSIFALIVLVTATTTSSAADEEEATEEELVDFIEDRSETPEQKAVEVPDLEEVVVPDD